MDRFYCPELTHKSLLLTLPADESHHITNVFRKKTGEQIEVTNGAGLVAISEIEKIDRQIVTCRVLNIIETPPPLPRIHLAISTIRPKRMDWAVEKLTELGVHSIQPLIFKYTNVKTFKINHLQKIAVSALKQSRQAFLPTLAPPLSFSHWLSQLSQYPKTLKLLAHLSASAVGLQKIALSEYQDIWLIIGPEGGFCDTELAIAHTNKCEHVKLSNTILRAETAAVTAIAQAKSTFL